MRQEFYRKISEDFLFKLLLQSNSTSVCQKSYMHLNVGLFHLRYVYESDMCQRLTTSVSVKWRVCWAPPLHLEPVFILLR
jgi:hypothetical protein